MKKTTLFWVAMGTLLFFSSSSGAEAKFDTVTVRGINPYTNFSVTMLTADFKQTDQTIFGKNIVLKIHLAPKDDPRHILLGICYIDSLRGNVPIVVKIILDGFNVKALILRDKGTNNLSQTTIEDFVREALKSIRRNGTEINKTIDFGENLLGQLSKSRRGKSVFLYKT